MNESSKKNGWQFIKFTLFSCTAGIVQVVSFTFLAEIVKFTYWPAYLIALVLSVLYNFTVNRKFTFRATSNVPIAMLKIFIYYCIFTPISTIGGDFLTETWQWNYYLVLAICMVSNFITEFLVYKIFVYPKD